MRIMHFTESMASGVLKYLQEVVRAEDSQNVEHFIVYAKRSHTPTDMRKLFPDSVHLINIDMNIREGFIHSIQALNKYIHDINPDIIHLHSSIAGFFGRLVTLCFPKIKVFYTPHGYSFLMTNKLKLIRAMFWLVEFVLSQIKGNIIACSKSEYQYGKKISPFRQVFLLENCIKNLHFQKQENLTSYRQVIGVGRMEEQKNPRLFVEIAAQLRQIDPTIKAVWIGDGSLKSECEDLNRSLNAEVIFAGWLSNEETLRYLQKSTVFLQTSKWEGLPYSLLESFAVGLPVVASNINSHTDLIGNNYMGFIAKNRKDFIDYTFLLLNDVEMFHTITSANKVKLKQNYIEFSKMLYSIYRQQSE